MAAGGSVRGEDPLVGFQFSLDVDGLTGYFTEVSGIGSENAVATHKVVTPHDGAAPAKEIVLQVPGRAEWGEITLKRGLTGNVEFWDWREQVIAGDTANSRKAVTITMYDRNYVAVVTWSLINAWPSKLTGPQISSDSNDFTIEELVLVHEGLYRDAGNEATQVPAFLAAAGGGGGA
jgi:phage tail-like protein